MRRDSQPRPDAGTIRRDAKRPKNPGSKSLKWFLPPGFMGRWGFFRIDSGKNPRSKSPSLGNEKQFKGDVLPYCLGCYV